MTPHRAGGHGTFALDRRFRGVGRICRASGTTDPVLFRRLNTMLDDLMDAGRMDVLVSLREGRIKPLELWGAYRTYGARRLPTGADAKPINAVLETWTPETRSGIPVAPKTAHDYRYAIRKLVGTRSGVLSDLPGWLQASRPNAAPAMFNRQRASLLTLARQVTGLRSDLWLQLSAIPPKEEAKNRMPGLPIIEARALAEAMGTLGHDWWTWCCTGMHWKEWDGAWEVHGQTLRIHGTKRKGRERVIPLLCRPTRPQHRYAWYQKALKPFGVTMYVGRRTFAHLLAVSGIPRDRIRRYLGHGMREVTDLYTDHAVEPYLASDRERLLERIGEDFNVLRRMA